MSIETTNPSNSQAAPAGEHLSDNDFQRLSTFIQSQYGIRLPQDKKSMLEGRLRKRMRTIRISSFKHYCDYVFTKSGQEEELIHMVDAVTTNKTDFFREPAHFTYLIGKALPDYIRNMGNDSFKSITLWSAACSTGEEPYTLAMVMSDYALRNRDVNFTILATDISTRVLSAAHKAIYENDKIEPISLEMRKRYLLKSKDPARRVVRIAPELREKVLFRRLNLVEPSYNVPSEVAVIFCRNVLIYFDAATQERIIRQFCRHLAPGGYLFVGHAETLNNLNVPLQYVAPTIYRKVDVQ